MTQLKLFRPSSAPALELCTHYESTVIPSPNKERGNLFHLVIAQILRAKKEGKEITPEMAGPFIEQCDYALQVQEELIPEIGGIEEEVILWEASETEASFVTSGTIDLYAGPNGRPGIIDWKTGQERNYSAQLAVYGVATLGAIKEEEIDLHTVFVDQQTVHSETLTYDELRSRVDQLIEAVRDPASPYSINPYCGYCNCRATCPAWERERGLVSSLVPDSALTLNERFDILKNDPEKLSRFIVAFRRLKNLVEKVEQLDKVALSMIRGGATMDGLKIQKRKGAESVDALPFRALSTLVIGKEFSRLFKVNLEEAKKIWPKYMKSDFPDIQTGNPTEYLVMTK